jgi:hypothetical protein
MTTETVRLRQSPSGKYLGNPPQRTGPGANGIIMRRHGSGSGQTMPASVVTIGGLSAIPVDIQPGYLYELDLATEVVTDGLTGTGSYYTVYRTRDKLTQAWGSWTQFNAPVHRIPITPTRNDSDVMFEDVSFGVLTAAAVDAIEFGVYGNATNALAVTLYPVGCYARVTEYMP